MESRGKKERQHGACVLLTARHHPSLQTGRSVFELWGVAAVWLLGVTHKDTNVHGVGHNGSPVILWTMKAAHMLA